jgi:transposase
MKVLATIGPDIAKQEIQAHGADRAGRAAIIRRNLRHYEVERFFAELEPCVFGIEASGSAHHRTRLLSGQRTPSIQLPCVRNNRNLLVLTS